MRGGQGGAGRGGPAPGQYRHHPVQLPWAGTPAQPHPAPPPRVRTRPAPRVAGAAVRPGARPSAEAVSGQFGMVPPGEQNTPAADTGQRVARGGAGGAAGDARDGARRAGRRGRAGPGRVRAGRGGAQCWCRAGVPPRRSARPVHSPTRVLVRGAGLGWPGLAEPAGWDLG